MVRIYDVVMTHFLDADDFFIHQIQRHCAERGLNFFLVEPTWVEPFFEKLAQGKVWPRVLLNLHSDHHRPDDVYHRVVRLAHERNCHVIDPPDVAMAAFDKASLHPRLEAAGFDLPYTVIAPLSEVKAVVLSEDQLARLGVPFVIKPGLGYGKRGVVLDARGVEDLARSAQAWPGSSYLLQTRVEPRLLDGRPGYFRVFFAFGEVWPCWWNCYTDSYQTLTGSEIEAYRLQTIEAIVRRLAALTHMRFFSTELALTESGRFVLIDYVNDQCHMLTQTANPSIGVPDFIVSEIALCLVEGAQGLIRKGS